MVRNNDRWSALSLQDRADLIKLYVEEGITNLNEIKNDYNKLSTGGSTEDNTIYYDDTYVEPATVKAFDSTEDYNRYYGEQFGKQVMHDSNKLARKTGKIIYDVAQFLPKVGTGLDIAEMTYGDELTKQTTVSSLAASPIATLAKLDKNKSVRNFGGFWGTLLQIPDITLDIYNLIEDFKRPVSEYSDGGLIGDALMSREDYSNNIVNELKNVPTINTNIVLEAPARKLDGTETEQTISGKRPITDTEKVEYVIRKSRGATGDIKDPDNWGPLIRMGVAYGKKEVPVGWSVDDIPTKDNYTGAMMEGIGRMTDNNMGFVSTDDLVDKLGYTPNDFVDAYTKNTIPFKELGVIQKTGKGEKKMLTKAIGNREVPVYQTHKDTLSNKDLKYLYGELEKAIPKDGDIIYNTNSTSPDSPFKIGNSNIYYDGNNHNVVQVKLPDGRTAFKALDYYDFNPDNWGYNVVPKAKEALQFLNGKGNPYVMTTPWYLQEDTRSIEDRLLDYGIEYNSDGTLYIGKDNNGKKWTYEEALKDIEKHPYL